MMGRAFQEAGVFPWTEGADSSGPLAVLTPPREDGFFAGRSNSFRK